MFGFTPEMIEQWLAQHGDVPLIHVKSKKCGGCGQFLPKDLTEESWLLMGGETYHIREECMTNGVLKMRAKNPTWDWPKKNYEGKGLC